MPRVIREPEVLALPRDRLISTVALAKVLGLSERYLRDWLEERGIPHLNINQRWIINTSDLFDALEKKARRQKI